MGENSNYNSLSDIILEFETIASSNDIIRIPLDTYSGAIFFLYIAERAEPETIKTVDHREEKARGFITGIKNYIRNINLDINKTNVLHRIRDLSPKKPEALAYIIERKKNLYVKGIIRATYDSLCNGRTLGEIGNAVKSVQSTADTLKQNEYWKIYYAIERLPKK